MQLLRRFRNQLKSHGILLGAGLGSLGLLGWRLTTMPAGGRLAPGELQTLQNSASWHEVLSHALFMPYYALQHLSHLLLPGHSVLALRLPSVLFALSAILALLYVMRRWYGQRTTLFALFLLASSAALLHIGRLGTPDISFVTGLSLLIAVHVGMQHCNGRRRVALGWAAVVSVALYLPGLWWFVLAESWWQRKRLAKFFAGQSWLGRLSIPFMMIVLLTPLGYNLLTSFDASTLLGLLGLPALWPSMHAVIENSAAAILFISVRTPAEPALWLGHLPLFGALMTVGFIAGLLFYGMHWRSERTQQLGVYSLITLLLLAASGPVTRALALPLLFLLALGGIAYLLHLWLRRFPKNPVARSVGIWLVAVATALTCAYNLRQYFIAWPHNAETRAVFHITPPRND